MNNYKKIDPNSLVVQESGLVKDQIAGVDGGLFVSEAPMKLAPNQSPDMLNMRIEDGFLMRDHGIDVSSPAASSNIIGIGQSGNYVWRAFTSGGFLDLEYNASPSVIGPWLSVTAAIASVPTELVSSVNYRKKVVFAFGPELKVWDTDVTTTVDNLSADNPTGKIVAKFGDRILALNTVSNPREVAWCANDAIGDWSGSGSGAAILQTSGDHSSDDDALTGGMELGHNMFAVFGRKSIMRAFLTGQSSQAIGFVPFIDNLGCPCPSSIKRVPKGVIFVGDDSIVYFLGADGNPIPLSTPVGKAFRDNLDFTNFASGHYNDIDNEYWVSDGDVTWIFDLANFYAGKGLRWVKRSEGGLFPNSFHNPPSNAGTPDAVGWFVPVTPTGLVPITSTNTIAIRKNSDVLSGYWVSPSLNPAGRVATIREVTIFYNSPSLSLLQISASGDGGNTWTLASPSTIQATSTSRNKTVSVPFNDGITGEDVRIRISTLSNAYIRIAGYRPTMAIGGHSAYLG